MRRWVALAMLTTVAASPVAAQVMTPARYVAVAGAGDLYERAASELMLESTTDPKVRAFAQMMVTDHRRSTALLTAAARKARVRAAPPALTPAQREAIAQLRGEMGIARDATYLAQQRAAHGQALAVQQAYAADGTVAALRAVARRTVVVVQHHVAVLRAM